MLLQKFIHDHTRSRLSFPSPSAAFSCPHGGFRIALLIFHWLRGLPWSPFLSCVGAQSPGRVPERALRLLREERLPKPYSRSSSDLPPSLHTPPLILEVTFHITLKNSFTFHKPKCMAIRLLSKAFWKSHLSLSNSKLKSSNHVG